MTRTERISENSGIVNRLTALWALAESGLGGYMHALKIPFTGILVGGSAILLISLIAYFTRGSMRSILRATLLVLLVKFAVSPHTSLPAYVAVGFQGLMGALLLSIPLSKFIMIPLFFVIAMLESALQKFLLSTLLYGMDLWKSLDESAIKMASELGFDKTLASDFTLKIILLYCLIYFIWALLLSIFALKFPKLLESKSKEILALYENLEQNPEAMPQAKRKKHPKRKLLYFISILLFMSMAYFVNYSQDEAWLKAGILLIRTLFILSVYFTILTPLVKKLLEVLSKKEKNTQAVSRLITELTEIRQLLPIAWQLSQQKKPLFWRFPHFILNLIVLSLFLENHGENPVV